MLPRKDGRDAEAERDTRLPRVEKRLPRVKDSFLKKSKYRHLLDDRQANRWFRNNLRGSAVTAAEQLRRLGWICEHFDTSPKELARLSKRKAEDWTEDMISLLEGGVKRSSYISNCAVRPNFFYSPIWYLALSRNEKVQHLPASRSFLASLSAGPNLTAAWTGG